MERRCILMCMGMDRDRAGMQARDREEDMESMVKGKGKGKVGMEVVRTGAKVNREVVTVDNKGSSNKVGRVRGRGRGVTPVVRHLRLAGGERMAGCML